jgi:hypothetical protein
MKNNIWHIHYYCGPLPSNNDKTEIKLSECYILTEDRNLDTVEAEITKLNKDGYYSYIRAATWLGVAANEG